MEVNQLEEKWKSLNPNHITGFRSLRITGDSKPDIYVGLDETGNRCLILRLPTNYSINFPPSVKENLSLELFPKKKLIVLKLLFKDFSDLFDDLILSLFNKIKDTSDPALYTQEFIQCFFKWSEFFSDKVKERLSEETIKGLFGEVIVLNKLISDADSICINDILTSWKGPYDAVHDFVREHTNLEVKTKDASGSDICISSEYQLEAEQGKGLELIVIEVTKDPSGLSLKDVLIESKNLITERLGNFSILLKAIFKKGLTFQNLHEYDAYRYKLQSMTYYNATQPEFPKIIRSNLPSSINQVSYSIRTNQLESFVTSKNSF